MRGSVPALALVILGLLAPACSLSAQPAPDARSVQLQADTGASAEEIRKLEAATDKAARRAAFASSTIGAISKEIIPSTARSVGPTYCWLASIAGWKANAPAYAERRAHGTGGAR